MAANRCSFPIFPSQRPPRSRSRLPPPPQPAGRVRRPEASTASRLRGRQPVTLIVYQNPLHLTPLNPCTQKPPSPMLRAPTGTADVPDDVNPAQWQAINYRDGHLLIVAGPGTGKTHTLTYRVAHMTANVKPENILAITFTNKAAEEMHERLHRRIPEAAEEMQIGTFHSFCLQLLRRFIDRTGLPPDFTIAAPDEIIELARRIWPQHSASQRRDTLEEISQWKSRGVTHTTPDLIATYDRTLHDNGMLNLYDLLRESVRLLRDAEDIGNQTRRDCRLIFVDEYQDINAAQHALLRELVQDDVVITAIGDPNQAIYGFRGADLRFFRSFETDFMGAATLSLSDNYRSAADILTASGQVIENGDAIDAPDLTARIYTAGRLTIYETPTDKAEAEYVVHQIEKMIGSTSMFSQDFERVERGAEGERTFGDIAVLYRLNSQKALLEEAFKRSGIPFQTSGDRPLLEQTGVPEMIAFIRMAGTESVGVGNALRLLRMTITGFGDKTAKTVGEL